MNTYDVLRWAEAQTCGGPGPKAVLMALARMAGLKEGGQWEAWPSQQLLANITEQSVRTVHTQLKALEARGLITRSRRQRQDGTRTTDLVRLLLPAESAGGPPATGRGDHRQPVAELNYQRTTTPSATQQNAPGAAAAAAQAAHEARAADDPERPPAEQLVDRVAQARAALGGK